MYRERVEVASIRFHQLGSLNYHKAICLAVSNRGIEERAVSSPTLLAKPGKKPGARTSIRPLG